MNFIYGIGTGKDNFQCLHIVSTFGDFSWFHGYNVLILIIIHHQVLPSDSQWKGDENATFQLVLASNTTEAVMMFNYNKSGMNWQKNDRNPRKVEIGYWNELESDKNRVIYSLPSMISYKLDQHAFLNGTWWKDKTFNSFCIKYKHTFKHNDRI